MDSVKLLIMNICIIDDHQLIALSLQNLLAATNPGFVIRTYRSAEEFLSEDFDNWKPNIVLTDYLLPGMKGMQLMEKAKQKLLNCKFILLTSLADPHIIREAIAKGVSGFINKDISKEELFEAIEHALTKKGTFLNKSLKEKLLDEFLLLESETDYNLSPREKEVLQKICSGNTPKEIAYIMHLSINTVQQYIKLIMRKLKVNRTTELVVLAIEKGLFMVHASK